MRVLFAAIVAALLPFTAQAQKDWHFTIGEEMQHGVSVCLDLADAKAIVNADRDQGEAAGEKAWRESGRCKNITVAGGPKVGKIVYSARVKRSDGTKTLRVVEVLHPDGSMVIGYFLTIREVLPAGRGV